MVGYYRASSLVGRRASFDHASLYLRCSPEVKVLLVEVFIVPVFSLMIMSQRKYADTEDYRQSEHQHGSSVRTLEDKDTSQLSVLLSVCLSVRNHMFSLTLDVDDETECQVTNRHCPDACLRPLTGEVSPLESLKRKFERHFKK